MRRRGSRIGVHLFGWAARHPRVTLSVAVLCTVLGAIGAARIHPSVSIADTLSDDEPASRALARIAERFAAGDELIVIASLPDSEDRARGRLRSFARRLEDAIAASPDLGALCGDVICGAPPDFRRFIRSELIPAGLLYLDDAEISTFAARLSTDAIARQVRRNEELLSTPGAGGTLAKAILKDPLRLHEVLLGAVSSSLAGAGVRGGANEGLSTDGRSIMIRVIGTAPVSDLDYAKRLTHAIRDVADVVNEDHLGITLTGAYPIAEISERSIRGDMIRSITASIILLQLLFLVVYRRWLSFPLAVTPVVIGIIVAFGVSSLFSTHLTPLVAVIGAVLAGLGIDYAIHFLSHYTRERSGGLDHLGAVDAALLGAGPAMIAACVTSVIGFLALSRSAVEALRQFAIIGALGLAGALLCALTVLPALLGCFTRRSTAMTQPRLVRHGFDPLLAAVSAHARLSLATSIAIAALAVWACFGSATGGLRFDSDLSVMHPQPNPPLDAQRQLAERFSHAADSLIMHLTGDSEDSLVTLAHEVDERLRTGRPRDAGVIGTLGLASFIPNPVVIAARIARLRSIDTKRIVADFRSAVQESIFDPDAYEDYEAFLQDIMSGGPSPTVATLRQYPALARMMLPKSDREGETEPYEALTAVFFDQPLAGRESLHEAVTSIRDALSDLPGATLTGLSVVGHDTERAIRRDLARLLVIAAAVVTAWLLCYFRSVLDTALALLPALFGTCVLVGVMAVLDLRFNVVNLIGVPLLIGIGVDDGIFLVSLAKAHRNSTSPGDPMLERLSTGCHAIFMTTLTTVLTFGSLMLTSVPAIRSLGVMMAVGMVACLVGTLFLLVPILAARHTNRRIETTRQVSP